MKKVTGQALGIVNKALGLYGSSSTVETEFLDASLDQVIDVAPLIRRGNSIHATTGLFEGLLRADSDTGGAGTYTVTAPVYQMAAVNVIPPYPPGPFPEDLEIWLLGASGQQIAGAGALTDGALFINYPDIQEGISIDEAGLNPGVISRPQCVAHFDTSFSATYTVLSNSITDQTYQKIGLRLPRNATLIWIAVMAGDAIYDCTVQLGVFPIGLGQDAQV